jgi:hypothetical protein
MPVSIDTRGSLDDPSGLMATMLGGSEKIGSMVFGSAGSGGSVEDPVCSAVGCAIDGFDGAAVAAAAAAD